MHSTDLKEKQMLAEWARRHVKDSFTGSREMESYFKDRDREDTYIMEYDFSTIADLKLLMKKVSRGSIQDEVAHILAVVAFKGKPVRKDERQNADEKQENIPEFIYVF